MDPATWEVALPENVGYVGNDMSVEVSMVKDVGGGQAPNVRLGAIRITWTMIDQVENGVRGCV